MPAMVDLHTHLGFTDIKAMTTSGSKTWTSSRLAAQFEGDRSRPILVSVARRKEAADKRLAFFDLERNVIPRLQAVKEVRCRDDRRVAIFLNVARKLVEHLQYVAVVATDAVGVYALP